MTEAASNYDRKANEAYFTPDWVTSVMMDHLTNTLAFDKDDVFLEPACGDGCMASLIHDYVPTVIASDKYPDSFLEPLSEMRGDSFKFTMESVDFLETTEIRLPGRRLNIITNPPYGKGGHLGAKFIRKALELTESSYGTVSMLLPMKFDSGSTRRDIFRDHPAFDCKIVLLDRIRWTNLPQKKAGPTGDHAWFFWDWGRSPAHDNGVYAPAIKYAVKADHEDES